MLYRSICTPSGHRTRKTVITTKPNVDKCPRCKTINKPDDQKQYTCKSCGHNYF